MIPDLSNTICAIATPSGIGAIAIIRISGDNAHKITNNIFVPTKKANNYPKHRYAYYGNIYDKDDVIDDVIVVFYKKPNSYTGEDAAEISCHGSIFIQNKILQLLINSGARIAEQGEFSLRAFTNNKMDLVQAEAVNEIINSSSGNALSLARKQMRGDYSARLNQLRQNLIDITALLELEIDFAEEDVEFASRNTLIDTCNKILIEVKNLAESFKIGNVLKNGIPVAILGKPNVGKSTILNAILSDERSIVSDIPGTTRDYIEDTFYINNTEYRFIDTAGLRHSTDQIESVGIERSLQKASEAAIILLVLDGGELNEKTTEISINELKKSIPNLDNKKLILVVNKIDVAKTNEVLNTKNYDIVYISAKYKKNIKNLLSIIHSSFLLNNEQDDFVLTNIRHYNSCNTIADNLQQAINHIEMNMPQDLIAGFLRQSLYNIGIITGEVFNEDVLNSIFSKFCIGK